MGTNNTCNRGIIHLRYDNSNAVVCKSRRAIMATTRSEFLTWSRRCMKCQKVFDRWEAREAE